MVLNNPFLAPNGSFFRVDIDCADAGITKIRLHRIPGCLRRRDAYGNGRFQISKLSVVRRMGAKPPHRAPRAGMRSIVAPLHLAISVRAVTKLIVSVVRQRGGLTFRPRRLVNPTTHNFATSMYKDIPSR